MIRFALACLMFAACVRPPDAGAAEAWPVVGLEDDDTLVLAGTAGSCRRLRLAGVRIPRAAERGGRGEPAAAEAGRVLAELTVGREVTAEGSGEGPDRWGRCQAQVALTDGRWLQGEMLRRGLARVDGRPAAAGRAEEMLALESAARRGRRGLWRHPAYAVRDPGELERLLGTFQIVEGTVRSAARVKGTVYLNFGSDWRTDFTISAPNGIRRAFERAGRPLEGLEGRRVRVRGWLVRRNGPMIELADTAQIEPLDGTSAAE